jgi:hypothetical protein
MYTVGKISLKEQHSHKKASKLFTRDKDCLLFGMFEISSVSLCLTVVDDCCWRVVVVDDWCG